MANTTTNTTSVSIITHTTSLTTSLPTTTPITPDTTTPTITPTTLVPITVGEAIVTRIIDGDTIEVSINGTIYKVRYIGIDTPETYEYFGQDATNKNSELVAGRIVRLEKDISETDDYGRLLRYVYVDDLFVNAELVRLGYAQARAYPPDTKYQGIFISLEQEAKAAHLGIWALSLQIISCTSPVNTGSYATLTANTSPNAECTITVYYKSGASTASGLEPKTADLNGNVSWEWKIGSSTSPGEYKIVVSASLNGITVYQTVYFIVQ
jgi:endonuclease YncB( thermonuclease family)